MKHLRIMPGHFFQLDRRDEFEHHVGESDQYEDADICPNCDKPLIHYMGLDTRDSRLNLQDCGVEMLPLYYCLRCDICEDRFVYRAHATEIEIIAFETEAESTEFGETRHSKDWYDAGLPDWFPSRRIVLQPLSPWIEDLIERRNAGHKLTREEELRAAQEAGTYFFHGGPDFGATRQIGGIPSFFLPVPGRPDCLYCERIGIHSPMRFLASLVNDARQITGDPDSKSPPFFQQNYVVAYDGLQILFYICPHCFAIEVESIWQS